MLDFQIFLSNAMRFIPVKFYMAYVAVGQSYQSDAFHFPPTALSMHFL